ncbi:Uncharacterised protein [Pseudomonas aeruginosa]|nr:Uncharacterised protein [Pseudomonas aeruginosa]
MPSSPAALSARKAIRPPFEPALRVRCRHTRCAMVAASWVNCAGGRRARCRRSSRRGSSGFHVHAVEPQHVEVDVQVQRAAETLDQRHRAAWALARRCPLDRPTSRITRCTMPSTGPMASGLLANRNARVRKAQHPLPHRRGPNTSSTRCAHSRPCVARRNSGRTALLAEKPPALCTAVLAHHPQEAVLEHAATQVGIERLADIPGQRAASASIRQ